MTFEEYASREIAESRAELEQVKENAARYLKEERWIEAAQFITAAQGLAQRIRSFVEARQAASITKG